MALGVEMLVEGMFASARRVAGNDSDSTLCGDGLTEVIGIVGGIGHDHLGWQSIDQRRGLRHIAAMTRGESEPDRAAQPANRKVEADHRPLKAASCGSIARKALPAASIAPAARWQ